MRNHITDGERRARLVTRHHLSRSAVTVPDCVDDIALHSSDPASPFLAAWARVEGFSRSDLESALYEERTLWRLHAVRRTLFVVTFGDAAMFDAAVGSTVARRERSRLEGWLSDDGADTKAPSLLANLEEGVMAVLADGGTHRTSDLAAAIPGLGAKINVGSGKWSGRMPISSRLLYVLAMERKLVRAEPAGTWRSSQYHWAATPSWFSGPLETIDPVVGRHRLLDHYLASHGPATMSDIRWWSGWGAQHATAAIESAGAVAVGLDGGGEGWIARGDTGATEPAGRAVALLPGLDSAPMGWKERTWYLGDHGDALFDRNGNVGPTIWVDGRIVGGWGQNQDGQVETHLLERVDKCASEAVAARADELTGWLGGTVVTPRFRTPLERELSR